MDLYVFHPSKFEQLYNCSVLTKEEWLAERSPNAPFGIAIFLVSMLLMVLYIPCLVVMLKSNLIKNSSYKIMFFVGIVDVCSLLVNGIGSGYFSYVGAVPCSYIDVIFLFGYFALACWYLQGMTCGLLACNRFYILWKSHMSWNLFEGMRIYVWIFLCLIYALTAAFFQKSLLFTSKVYSWLYNPYFGIEHVSIDPDLYTNPGHLIHNLSIAGVLPVINVALIFQLRQQLKEMVNSQFTKIQALITIQSILICFFTLMTGLAFLSEQYIKMPLEVNMVTNFIWSVSNGAPAVMYLVINRTIRNRVFKMLKSTNNKISEAISAGYC
ncbi:hypothetical protein L596_020299 [Steinernema carpocapsae]|uniref:G-protein coupled receptors family 1 profile domain-containing protein n=1 Tax=Steinernema carpocapsae TaxID=34508 RepID=A0A4V6A0V9_STECR|nr:hypothetical protein L596_020299 [Steinernema carpocapsae]